MNSKTTELEILKQLFSSLSVEDKKAFIQTTNCISQSIKIANRPAVPVAKKVA
ncbi:hypothetical protein CIG11343_1574 [Campylobacter iguaniorum]|uniref:hypothetical protein n=1 Tax=Campylobacter iguaniorum TaxID=1244531 RepID=UPI0007C9BC9D|nr:hypothetical protein [Campylobacter iguaniorum]ANE36554.1 hypothetical protein CIG11343_1574 [Campylobacter iguaniorum]